MKLKCYAVVADPPPLVPAPPDRDWMDMTSDRFAYRCLPLAIANAYGWEILSPCTFAATWNGGQNKEDIKLRCLDDYPHLDHFCLSHFNHGIITFHLGYMFRTEPGWDTLVTGPVNRPKDGIYALTGVVETDWLPFPFTMNWRFTRPGRVQFEKGEPICVIQPVRQGTVESVEPEILSLHDNPELLKEYQAWSESRDTFLKKLGAGDSETIKQAWQRNYFKGQKPWDETTIPHHKSRIRCATPVDLRDGKKKD